jgi:secondary thiamine-phosphate synthase enzyme
MDRSGPEAAKAMQLMQAHHRLEIATPGQGFTDVTRDAVGWLRQIQANEGLLTLFIRHTSASLVIQENADPDVQADLTDALSLLAPEDRPWRHSTEGPDDMPAHVKAMVTATSLSIPVIEGKLALGTWQAIYLIEHRTAPHRRELVLHYAGTAANPSAHR